MKLVHIPRANWKEVYSPLLGCRAFKWGYVTVIVGQEPMPEPNWHLSISTPYRLPTWEEVRQARYDFIPDAVTMAMILPPRREYINVHEFCFHLHEIPGEIALDEPKALPEVS